MSHLVKQKSSVKITDLDIMSEACKRLGLVLNRNKKIARYFGSSTTKCDAVIECPGANAEIALKKEADGSYSVSTDLYDGTLRAKVSTENEKGYSSANCDKLFQSYRVEETLAQAACDGLQVENVIYDPQLNEYALELNAGFGG